MSYRQLQRWDRAWKDCKRCELGANCSEPVVGRGGTPSPLLIVLSAPSQADAVKRRLLTGPGAAALGLALQRAGVEPAIARITSLVGCPAVGTPATPGQIATCRNRFIGTIAAVQPNAMLILGPVATVSLLGAMTLHKWVDYKYPWKGGEVAVPALATYHPSKVAPGEQRARFQADVNEAHLRAWKYPPWEDPE